MKYLISILIVLSASFSYAQNINWSSMNEDQRSMTYLNFGYDFGVTTQIGYGKKLDFIRPSILSLDYSLPMGENLLDDFKVRFGGQMSVYEWGKFVISAKAYGVFRRHQTSLVGMSSFGSEIAALAGYYKSTWYLAAELGFDKSISTYLKHSDSMRESYPAISDGWLTPSGGNWFYGFQAGKSIKEKIDLSLRVGVTNAQSNNEDALLPYYAQLGLIYKF